MPASAQDYLDILPQTDPVALDENDPARTTVGTLIYRGGLRIEPGEAQIGGLSGLEWHDGALWAVAGDGRWMRIVPDESDARLRDIYGMDIGTLHDLRGKRLKGKADSDAQAITRASEGGWLVGFGHGHRLWRYADLKGPAQPFEFEGPEIKQKAGSDTARRTGSETLAATPDGLLRCHETAETMFPNCFRKGGNRITGFGVKAPLELAEQGGVPSDAACTNDGVCYLLMKSHRPGAPRERAHSAAVIELLPDNSQRTLGVLAHPLNVGNFEGIALRKQYGKRYLYLVSNDNFENCYQSEADDCQHSVLMKFEIKSDDPPTPQVVDAAKTDPQFETVDVVLETAMGDITITLETERAPITAANFLRYVEEGRFDGTMFYRAMKLDREPKPNGLLQGGTQFDPKRILPGIAHEPTTKTGLSHTNGALSMAMGEPGSATGDFSIMLQDQTGLDARPDDPDPVWQNGYAVFGYVTNGMEVVAAIHTTGNDPDKGEGWMKGQMLAQPVRILRARRVQPGVQAEPEP